MTPAGKSTSSVVNAQRDSTEPSPADTRPTSKEIPSGATGGVRTSIKQRKAKVIQRSPHIILQDQMNQKVLEDIKSYIKDLLVKRGKVDEFFIVLTTVVEDDVTLIQVESHRLFEENWQLFFNMEHPLYINKVLYALARTGAIDEAQEIIGKLSVDLDEKFQFEIMLEQLSKDNANNVSISSTRDVLPLSLCNANTTDLMERYVIQKPSEEFCTFKALNEDAAPVAVTIEHITVDDIERSENNINFNHDYRTQKTDIDRTHKKFVELINNICPNFNYYPEISTDSLMKALSWSLDKEEEELRCSLVDNLSETILHFFISNTWGKLIAEELKTRGERTHYLASLMSNYMDSSQDAFIKSIYEDLTKALPSKFRAHSADPTKQVKIDERDLDSIKQWLDTYVWQEEGINLQNLMATAGLHSKPVMILYPVTSSYSHQSNEHVADYVRPLSAGMALAGICVDENMNSMEIHNSLDIDAFLQKTCDSNKNITPLVLLRANNRWIPFQSDDSKKYQNLPTLCKKLEGLKEILLYTVISPNLQSNYKTGIFGQLLFGGEGHIPQITNSPCMSEDLYRFYLFACARHCCDRRLDIGLLSEQSKHLAQSVKTLSSVDKSQSTNKKRAISEERFGESRGEQALTLWSSPDSPGFGVTSSKATHTLEKSKLEAVESLIPATVVAQASDDISLEDEDASSQTVAPHVTLSKLIESTYTELANPFPDVTKLVSNIGNMEFLFRGAEVSELSKHFGQTIQKLKQNPFYVLYKLKQEGFNNWRDIKHAFLCLANILESQKTDSSGYTNVSEELIQNAKDIGDTDGNTLPDSSLCSDFLEELIESLPQSDLAPLGSLIHQFSKGTKSDLSTMRLLAIEAPDETEDHSKALTEQATSIAAIQSQTIAPPALAEQLIHVLDKDASVAHLRDSELMELASDLGAERILKTVSQEAVLQTIPCQNQASITEGVLSSTSEKCQLVPYNSSGTSGAGYQLALVEETSQKQLELKTRSGQSLKVTPSRTMSMIQHGYLDMKALIDVPSDSRRKMIRKADVQLKSTAHSILLSNPRDRFTGRAIGKLPDFAQVSGDSLAIDVLETVVKDTEAPGSTRKQY